MDTDKARTAIRALLRVRNVFEEALAPASSLILIDLLLAAASLQQASPPGRAVTVKQLFAQLPHSDRAVRIHFNRLVADGMLIAETGPVDRRTKVVRLSPRGERLLQRAATALLQPADKPAGATRAGAVQGRTPASAKRRPTKRTPRAR